MNKIALSLGAVVALNSFSFAGGDFTSVEPVEPVVVAPVFMEADESSFYVGIGLAAISTRDSSVDLSFTSVKQGQDRLGNVALLAGYNINKYFAVEGRYSTTFTDEDRVEMDSLSIYAKPKYPLSEEFSVYALLGYGTVTMKGVNGSGVDVDDSGFQWGLGLDWEVANNTSIFIDYSSLASDMGGVYYNGALEVDADAITVGVTYKF